MNDSCNPWGQLLELAARPQLPAAALRGQNPTAQLLSLIAQRPHGTAELAQAVGLCTRRVWGLLKNARASGQVSFSGSTWQHNHDWLPADIERAAQLLRAAGWRVERPPCNPRAQEGKLQ